MAAIERAPQPSYVDDEHHISEKGKAVRNLVEANLLDDRYATTKRGLKNRHVQLMALGGTIGTGNNFINPTV
jgi:amino acid transporter